MKKRRMALVVLMSVVWLTGCGMQRVSGLQGDGKAMAKDFNINESQYFQDVQNGKLAHCIWILVQLNEKAAEVREENKIQHEDTETTTNPDGTTTTTTKKWYEYPDVEVMQPEPPLAPAMAYMQMIDEDILKGNKFVFEEAKIFDFYNKICSGIIVEGSGMSFTVRVEYLPNEANDYTSDETETMATRLFSSTMPEYIQSRGCFIDATALYDLFLQDAGYTNGSGDGYNPGSNPGYVGNIVFDETIGGQVCSWGISKVGCSYSQANRFGEHSFDCSSLVYRAYNSLGINISYGGASTAAEIARGLIDRGCQIGYDELQPGDLIFYSSSTNGRYRNITHVAMYIGENQIVHARSTKYGVRVDPVSLYQQSSIRAITRPSGLIS